jgi:hypothetical protein
MLTEYSTLGPKSASMGLPGVYRIRDAHRLTHGTVAGLQRIVRRLDFQGCIKIDEEESQTKSHNTRIYIRGSIIRGHMLAGTVCLQY